MSMFGEMFVPKMGSWSVTSTSDPRWNGSGRAAGLVSAGGPDEIYAWIDACKEKYGALPDDLTMSFMKD